MGDLEKEWGDLEKEWQQAAGVCLAELREMKARAERAEELLVVKRDLLDATNVLLEVSKRGLRDHQEAICDIWANITGMVGAHPQFKQNLDLVRYALKSRNIDPDALIMRFSGPQPCEDCGSIPEDPEGILLYRHTEECRAHADIISDTAEEGRGC